MSDTAMRWARHQRAGGATPNALLHWLARRVDPGHHSRYCSVREIAEDLEVSERTVYNAVARLVNRQLLRVLRRGHPSGGRGSNRLQLLVDGPDTPLPPHQDWTGVYDPAEEASKAQARKAARDQQQPTEEQSKPANVAGLVETAPEVHPGGQTCRICRHEPATVAGSNLHDLQVSSNKEKNPHRNPLPPPPAPPGPPGRPAAVTADEDEEERHSDATPVANLDEARQVLERLQADLTARLAGWQQRRLLPLLAAALTAGWPPGGLYREIHRGGDPGLADNPYGALRWRIRQLGPPPVVVVPDPPPAVTAGCPDGRCDGSGWITTDIDHPAVCSACRPQWRQPAAAG
ncbi:helix-turn-helix domain-containing protein [Micromonospora thermarum]|uniref:HTH domain-containing protein n=1 Tax=Micromonospora thermarum TaxID=2720024 RepID=A0ABX0Z786_9ACTN|nr:helix-turn-helix domain-containing protein [Micromonospora thermarum]NJP33717.1 HTH domain-containing protein [Micromonospora thermarum]